MTNERKFRELLAQPALACLLLWFATLAIWFVCLGSLALWPDWQALLGPEAPSFTTPLYQCFVALAALYGFARAQRYHPNNNAGYREWLTTTPWTPRHPLPLGPVHLVWQDAAAIALLCGFSCVYLSHSPIYVFVGLASGYAAGILFELPRRQQSWPYVYALLGIAGALTCFHHIPAVLLIGSLALLLVASTAARHSVAVFAYRPSNDDQAAGLPAGFLEASNPRPTRMRVPLTHAILISSLLGWWTYVSLDAIPAGDLAKASCRTWLVCAAALLAMGRYVLYRIRRGPPIGLFSRLRRGVILIPGYDRIWIAPVISLATGFSTLLLGSACNLDTPALMALALTATILPLLAVGPALQDWDLTARGHFPSFRL